MKEKPNICVHIALQYVVDTKISPDDMLCVWSYENVQYNFLYCVWGDVGSDQQVAECCSDAQIFITSDRKSDEQQQKFEDKGCLKWGQWEKEV